MKSSRKFENQWLRKVDVLAYNRACLRHENKPSGVMAGLVVAVLI